jgi:hypothetical protein
MERTMPSVLLSPVPPGSRTPAPQGSTAGFDAPSSTLWGLGILKNPPSEAELPAGGVGSEAPVPTPDGPDPLLEFRPERVRLDGRALIAVAAGAMLVMAFVLVLLMSAIAASPVPEAASTSGLLMVTSNPAGARVRIDTEDRGVTPLKLTLDAGPHMIEITSGASKRALSLSALAGAVVSQHVEFVPQAPALAAAPPAPVAAAPVAAAPLRARAAREAPRAVGNVVVRAPIDLQILEGDRVIGSSSEGVLEMSSGLHTLDLVSDALEFRTRTVVNVSPREPAVVAVDVPTGRLSVNAMPWAEVFVDGSSFGMTPLGSIRVPIGTREVLLRHPRLGEIRRTVVVKARSTTLVGEEFVK